jgi:hypothetical protein
MDTVGLEHGARCLGNFNEGRSPRIRIRSHPFAVGQTL